MEANIQKLLESETVSDVKLGLARIKEEGTVADIPFLCNLLKQNSVNEIYKEIIELLSNVKDPKAVDVFVEQIVVFQNIDLVLQALLQVSWQSSLDFSSHLILYTKLFFEMDLVIAIEAFSVIEDIFMNYTIEESLSKEFQALLDENYPKLIEEKSLLLDELKSL